MSIFSSIFDDSSQYLSKPETLYGDTTLKCYESSWNIIDKLHSINLSKSLYCEKEFSNLMKNDEMIYNNLNNFYNKINILNEININVKNMNDQIEQITKKSIILENVLDIIINEKNNKRIGYMSTTVPDTLLKPYQSLETKYAEEYKTAELRFNNDLQEREWRELAELEATRHQQFQSQMAKYKSKALLSAQNAPLEPVILKKTPILSPMAEPHDESRLLQAPKDDNEGLSKISLDVEEHDKKQLNDFYDDEK